MTVARQGSITPGDRSRALTTRDAWGVISRLFSGLDRDANRHTLCELHRLAIGDPGVAYSRAETSSLTEQVLAAVSNRRILVLDGWMMGRSWTPRRFPVRGGLAAVAAADDDRESISEVRIASRAMGGRQEEVAFEGARYVLLPASRWRELKEQGGFEVVRQDEAAAVLQRMTTRAVSADQKAALDEAAKVLADTRKTFVRDGLFLARRRSPVVVAARDAQVPVTPSDLRRVSPAANDLHDLLFEYRSNTGHPIGDGEGFELVGPSGAKQRGTLSNGRLERNAVEPGEYELRPRRIVSAAWQSATAHPFEKLTLLVETRGIPDGTKVDAMIRRNDAAPDAPPVAAVAGSVSGDQAILAWEPRQEVGGACRGKVHVEIAVGKKFAWTSELSIEPHDLPAVRGVQERLRALGYDPGAPADEMGSKVADALKQFQADRPPLQATGTLDDFTLELLAESA